ncbi:MAG: RdgB/HAM1 family non-canonical purine NTP pyrophosphatase [Phycisphaerales bacterium]
MTSVHPIVLATGNPHKLDELRAIFAAAGYSIPLISLSETGVAVTEPEETGTTFAENAAVKAVQYAKQTGRFCLADDSGLEIDALDGRPGVISSHYSTGGRETGLTRPQRDEANNARVLKELAGVPDVQRSARFVCCMSLAGANGEVIARSRGTFEGRIGVPPRVPAGVHGFGYDPLFLVAPAFDRTSAELSATEKNRLSHRGLAALEMARRIIALGWGRSPG